MRSCVDTLLSFQLPVAQYCYIIPYTIRMILFAFLIVIRQLVFGFEIKVYVNSPAMHRIIHNVLSLLIKISPFNTALKNFYVSLLASKRANDLIVKPTQYHY